MHQVLGVSLEIPSLTLIRHSVLLPLDLKLEGRWREEMSLCQGLLPP